MDKYIAWIITVIALWGTWLNANQDKKGFYFWMFSNFAFFVINLKAGHMALAFLFAAYFILAIRGLEKWE